jgi:hypothetical protein
MTEQEIKVHAIDFAIRTLALLPEKELTEMRRSAIELNQLASDFVIRHSLVYQEYLRDQKQS